MRGRRTGLVGLVMVILRLAVGMGCSVVFGFVEFGVLLVECRALFPESGFVNVKAPFSSRESCVFSGEPLVSF